MAIGNKLKEVINAQGVIFIGLILVLFLFTNSEGTSLFKTVLLYSIFGIVSLFAFRLLFTKKIFGVEFMNKSDWIADVIIGLLIGVAFIVANQVSPAITIGFPGEVLSAGTDETNRNIVVGGIAPIFEEVAFRGLLLGVLLSLGLGFFTSAIIQGLAFMVFHLQAYGLGSDTSGALFGAMIFAMGMAYLIKWRNNLLSVIVVHSVFNLYLVTKALVFVAI